MKKYEFTGETMEFEGHTLRRIRFLRSCSYYSKASVAGGEGGWIESEHNLSHEGNCYVAIEGKVFGNARLTDDAVVTDFAIVKDNVQLKENSNISRFCIISGDTIVAGETKMIGTANITFFADEKYGEPNLYGDTFISGKTVIEATGYLFNCRVFAKSLSGHLELRNENIRGYNT